MGCGSHRKKQTEEFVDQKWDYINLKDFKAKGCGPGFAYAYLWFSLILSVAVYGVDSFTAFNLLAYNRWSSEIQPGIPLDVARWIFAICVILSFVNLGYEAVRAFRVIRRGNVAECYLDSLAVRWESIRLGKGQGWRRFLVFAELTKGKKGGEYIALFTYFNLQSWIRVLICSGPRQVVNVFTLISVYQAKLAVSNEDVGGSISEFFNKVAKLAEDNYQQAAILGGMCFTLVVWFFSALFLLAACCFYVFFLFHWLPRADGGLSGYCTRKINKAVLRVVTIKVNKALAKGQAQALRTGEKPELGRVATGTLPTLPNVGPLPPKTDALAAMPMLGRNDTTTTLPAYTPRPGSPGTMELADLQKKRPLPSRNGTMASVATSNFSANAPLIGGAADMGYERSNSPQPTLPNIDLGMLPALRPGTASSQKSFGPPRPGYQGHFPGNSASSLQSPITQSPEVMSGSTLPPMPRPSRSGTSNTMNGPDDARQVPASSRTYDAYNTPSRSGSAPPAKQYEAYNPTARSPTSAAANPYSRNGSTPGPPGPMNQPPYQPSRSATGPVPPRGPPYGPQRNMTAPIQPPAAPGGYFDRPMTPQSPRGPPSQGYGSPAPSYGQRRGPGPSPYGYDVESQRQRDYRSEYDF